MGRTVRSCGERKAGPAGVLEHEALHQETAAAMAQPKASRKATLAKEYFDEVTGLIQLLDKLGSQLITSVKLEDAYIDQLLQIKQLAWLARNNGGEASSMISNTLAGQPLPADAMTGLGTRRADAVLAALKEAGVEPARLAPGAPEKLEVEAKGPVPLKLALDAK